MLISAALSLAASPLLSACLFPLRLGKSGRKLFRQFCGSFLLRGKPVALGSLISASLSLAAITAAPRKTHASNPFKQFRGLFPLRGNNRCASAEPPSELGVSALGLRVIFQSRSIRHQKSMRCKEVSQSLRHVLRMQGHKEYKASISNRFS